MTARIADNRFSGSYSSTHIEGFCQCVPRYEGRVGDSNSDRAGLLCRSRSIARHSLEANRGGAEFWSRYCSYRTTSTNRSTNALSTLGWQPCAVSMKAAAPQEVVPVSGVRLCDRAVSSGCCGDQRVQQGNHSAIGRSYDEVCHRVRQTQKRGGALARLAAQKKRSAPRSQRCLGIRAFSDEKDALRNRRRK